MLRLPALFDGLNDIDVYAALRYFQTRPVGPGDVVFREGEPADSLVCVKEGALEVRHADTVLGRIGAGEVVGEMGLFETARRKASVVAVAPGALLVLDRQGYEKMRDVLHPLSVNLERAAIRLQVDRLRAVGDRIAQLAQGTPAAPTTPGAAFLATIAAQFGRGGLFSTTAVDAVAALRKSPVFADAPDDALAEIAAVLRPRAYGAGHFLCTEGEVGSSMFLLDEGEVDVVVATENDRVQTLVTLKPGAAFGMVALVQGKPRMSSCVARTRVVVHTLERDGWERLVGDPGLAGSAFRRAMIRVIGDQLAYTNDQLAEFEAREAPVTLMRAGAGVDAHGPWLAEG